MDTCLVVWNMAFMFPYIGNVIIPTDELIFFRGVGQPPTRNDILSGWIAIEHSYWKWPCIVIFPIKMWFSIVTLVYQRVPSPCPKAPAAELAGALLELQRQHHRSRGDGSDVFFGCEKMGATGCPPHSDVCWFITTSEDIYTYHTLLFWYLSTNLAK